MVAFDFFPKTLRSDSDLRIVLCHLVNADKIVAVVRGGGDSQTLSYEKDFFALTGSDDTKTQKQ